MNHTRRPIGPRGARLFGAMRWSGVFGLAIVAYLATERLLAARHITTGFDFLGLAAGFDIGESAIRFDATDTIARALFVGILNTLKVSLIASVFASVLASVVTVARIGSNPLLRGLGVAYVELLRNIPLLLQLFIWYGLLTLSLPGVREAWHPLPGVFLSNRGVWLPGFDAHLGLSIPTQEGLGFDGGWSVSPELAALTVGLAAYASSYLSEILCGALAAVPKGQQEAASALGLTPLQTLRLVTLPQASRIALLPATTEYLNVLKNSSLAVAIGYPDLVSVGNTVMNQTGQAIEVILLFAGVYLILCIAAAGLANATMRHWARHRR